MKNDWLVAWSFEREQELVSATNTLLIHTKLRLAGVDDPTPKDDVDDARDRIVELLERIASLVSSAEHQKSSTIVGVDPRLGELALHFLSRDRRAAEHTLGPRLTPERFAELAGSDRTDDAQLLIPALEDLRAFLESQAQSDVTGILGNR